MDESFLETSDKCVDALLYGDERSDDRGIADVFDIGLLFEIPSLNGSWDTH